MALLIIKIDGIAKLPLAFQGEHSWQILSMSFSSATPLRHIAMEEAINSVRADDPDLIALPRTLRSELETRRSSIAQFGTFFSNVIDTYCQS